jgi:hypothetical protein
LEAALLVSLSLWERERVRENRRHDFRLMKTFETASRTRVYVFLVDQNFFERRSGYQVRGQPLFLVFRKPVSQEKPEGARLERESLSKDLLPDVSDSSLQSGPCFAFDFSFRSK